MRIFIRSLGILMILAAIVLFFWQDIREYFTDQVNDRLITAYQDGDDDVKLNPIETLVTGVEQDTKGINIGENMAGVLEIASADILEPLYYGPLTEEKLRNGVSMLEETDHLDMQNIPIAGHRVEGAGIRFNYIDRAEVGDEINLITRDETRVYKITEMFEVEPSEVSVLDQNEGDVQELTLVTCEDYNPDTLLFEKRLIVTAELVEAE
ncbi:Sortase family protein [Jeotgalicoccus saudimassiliensis]|uniref:Sortase family protein n=1 Tax=Jeotgalicoccus saudimassiliensis TaxID=1461582 RepID=A0A078LWB9_9STAP|nr:sortase [Jeotgalicoccus saudimassiliensis]CDZ99498.1 Sortase family protein [Jeotgalicoccus saudimassiliensis]